MGAVFIVILVVAILAVLVIGYALGLFKIEKVEVVSKESDFTVPEEAGDGEEDNPDLDDDLTLKEKMDLTGILNQEAAQPVTRQEDMEERYTQYDQLSNFKTGRGYLIDCQKSLDEAKGKGEIYAAARFDFDRFRFINSLKGMSIGDYVLTKLSQELTDIFPEGSHITRISADHFAAVFPVTGGNMFATIDGRLRELCEKLRADVAVKSGLRISLGVAATNSLDRDYDISILLHKANLARHSIKVSRSETWKLFEDSMITSYLYGESALEDYSENQYADEIVIYYVPYQDLNMRNLSGAEALARWACEDNLTKGPPSGIDKGKLPTNSSKIIYQTCKAMSRWRKSGKQVLPVSVHIPIIELCKSDLDEFLGRCLSEFQLEPALLSIVVEASVVRTDWSVASRQMKRLRDIGIKIGVDEIDLGYKSLDFLRDLPVNFIKLHRGFSAEIQQNEEHRQAVKRMLEEASAMNLRMIVEGVDSQGQMKALQELGVREVQGGYVGGPLLADDFVSSIPDHVEKHYGEGTVILDDLSLNKGDFNLF